jgi:hypothetical protein
VKSIRGEQAKKKNMVVVEHVRKSRPRSKKINDDDGSLISLSRSVDEFENERRTKQQTITTKTRRIRPAIAPTNGTQSGKRGTIVLSDRSAYSAGVVA